MTSTTPIQPSSSTSDPPLDELRDELAGRVIVAGDPDYDRLRQVFHGATDARPAAIARVAGAADVARVVALARDAGVELAVRGGGHSGAGHGVVEGGIVIDLRDLDRIEIDPQRRSAWAEAGMTAGAYTAAAAAHGLATGFGDAGSVGIAGITLSGGIGYLVRKHGMTIDQLLAAEIVTADGSHLYVDADNHPDLFWALRGGGGNFGVVTRLRYRLHELDTVGGGTLVLPARPEVIAGFVELADAAPDELSAIANVMPAPPLPFLASEHHGRPVVLATLVGAGEPAAAERALAPFRELATPLAEMLGPRPYPDVFPPEDPEHRPVATARTLFTDSLDLAAAERIVAALESSTAIMAVAQVRVLGGAMARVAPQATAFAHRESRIMVNVAAIHERPDQAAEHEPWVTGLAAALRRGDAGAYVGFLGDEGAERVRAAYPGPTWDRLAEIKARYDPGNLFRRNQNVAPRRGS